MHIYTQGYRSLRKLLPHVAEALTVNANLLSSVPSLYSETLDCASPDCFTILATMHYSMWLTVLLFFVLVFFSIK